MHFPQCMYGSENPCFLFLLQNRALIQKALTGALVVPDWKEFTRQITELAERVEPLTDGMNAQYIPELKNVDPDQFGELWW